MYNKISCIFVYTKQTTMKKFTKTYYLDKFRIRVWISDTSDRLTIYNVLEDGRVGQRLKYEMYFKRENIIDRIFKDLMDVKIPYKTICEVLTDVQMNLG